MLVDKKPFAYKKIKTEKMKTLGPQAAKLTGTLYERDKPVFTYSDVVNITGLRPKAARNFVAALVGRGVVSRLKPGLFTLVPFELGFEKEYMGNPFVVARELVADKEYYISHASAMDIHQMVTQPQLKVYVMVLKAIRPRFVMGTEFCFVRCKSAHFFGISDLWVTKSGKVKVSDPEKTVIDGLKQPEYCGGFSEVAKGFWMRRDTMNISKLTEYAIRLNIGAVIRRLGFLLEVYQIDAPREIAALRENLTPSHVLLDPVLPREGKYNAKWRLRLNMDPEELLALVRT